MISLRGRWRRTHRKRTTGELLQLDMMDIGCILSSDEHESKRSIRLYRGENVIAVSALPGSALQVCHSYKGLPATPRIIRTVFTIPNFGGQRPWFVCPGCGERARILYGQQFLCRACQGLTYPSCRVGKPDSMVVIIGNRKRAIAKRLVYTGGDLLGRPWYMHNMTYMRLATEYLYLADLEVLALLSSLTHAIGGTAPPKYDARSGWNRIKEWRARGYEGTV